MKSGEFCSECQCHKDSHQNHCMLFKNVGHEHENKFPQTNLPGEVGECPGSSGLFTRENPLRRNRSHDVRGSLVPSVLVHADTDERSVGCAVSAERLMLCTFYELREPHPTCRPQPPNPTLDPLELELQVNLCIRGDRSSSIQDTGGLCLWVELGN